MTQETSLARLRELLNQMEAAQDMDAEIQIIEAIQCAVTPALLRKLVVAYDDRERLRMETIGALTDAGIPMLVEGDPTAPGEVAAAIGRLPAAIAEPVRPVTPLRCPKCYALWLFWPHEQSGFGQDTLSLQGTKSCEYCEPAGSAELEPLNRTTPTVAGIHLNTGSITPQEHAADAGLIDAGDTEGGSHD